MATAPGHLMAAAETGISPGRAPWLAAPIPMQPGAGWHVGDFEDVGDRTFVTVELESREYDGHGAWDMSFGAQFYNRIHISPTFIALGNLLTAQTRQVEIWNSHLVDVELQSIEGQNFEGLSLNEPLPVPSTFPALRLLVYTLTAVTDGPSSIDALFVWTINDEEYVLRVTGSRVTVFPFAADWRDGVEDTLEWLTVVERAYSGDEQRARLRDAPRRTMSYNLTLLDKHMSARMESILFGWQARNFAVPIVTDRSRLTSNANAGALSLSLDTSTRAFYAGESVLLYKDYKTYETAEIDAVASDSVSLVRPLGANWPVGSMVYPVGIGHLAPTVPLTRESDYYVTARITWRFKAGPASIAMPTSAVPLTYRGQEVYLGRMDWSQRPTFDYQDAFVVLGENESGLLEFEPTSDFPTIVRQSRIVLKDRLAIYSFLAFLGRRAGRWSPVWLASGNDDFEMVENVGSTATVIRVTDNGYGTFIDQHDARRDIAIFRRGFATPIMRRILGTVDNLDGTINLTLDSQVGVALNVDQVRRICHLNLYRLGSDQVTRQWLTNTVMVVQPSWILVKE